MIQFLRRLLEAIPYLLAIPIGLMAPLWVFGIPGKAEPYQIVWFVCSFFAMLAYPLALFAIGVERFRVWRGRGRLPITRLRQLPWMFLGLLLVIQSPIFYSAYSEWRRSVLWWETASPPERMRAAIQGSDADRLIDVLDQGIDVDHPLFFGSSAALMSAEQGDWELVEILLERGADPDRANERGETLRNAFPDLEARTRSEDLDALERVRILLEQSASDLPSS